MIASGLKKTSKGLKAMSDLLRMWVEQYAGMLDCEPRAAAVAAAIERLKTERDQLKVNIPKLIDAARDDLLVAMRREAVNCGARSSCSVSHWFKLSTERGKGDV